MDLLFVKKKTVKETSIFLVCQHLDLAVDSLLEINLYTNTSALLDLPRNSKEYLSLPMLPLSPVTHYTITDFGISAIKSEVDVILYASQGIWS